MEPSFNVADLSHRMRDFSIQQSNRRRSTAWRPSASSSSEPSSPTTVSSNSSFATTAPNTPPMTPLSSTHQVAASSSRHNSYHASSIRAQRQRAIRNQCSSGHLDEIAALVSRMVNSGEQCSVCSASRPPSPAPASAPSIQSPLSSHQPVTLARRDTDSSDGSVSPFSHSRYTEDEPMDDIDRVSSGSEIDTTSSTDESEYEPRPGLGDWNFSWGSRARPTENSGCVAERKCWITKDTRSRKQQSRRRRS